MDNTIPHTGSDIPSVAPEKASAKSVASKKKSKEPKKEEQKTLADQLVALCLKSGTILFHDQFETPFAQVPVGDHGEVWSLESDRFKTWLGRQYWADRKKAVSATALNDAITTLKGIARFDKPKIALHVRTAWHEGAIWYDLSDEKWRAIRITPDTVEIIEKPPILFRRWPQQAAQVVPDPSGSLTPLLNFCTNLSNEKTKLLLLVALVTCLVPGIPHVVFQFHGPKGSTKSTLARQVRDLIDPSTLKTLSFPSKYDDVVLALKSRYFAFFDNISHVSDEVSNLLCRAVTGDGVTRRKLYSDDEEIPAVIQCCIGLNGINLTANASDLLERSILFEFAKVPKNKRQTEDTVWSNFAKARSGIVGGLFNALARAMKIYPTIQLSEKPRMADFAVWGCAVAEALGYDKDTFLDAYHENINEQHRVVVQEHQVANAIQVLVRESAFEKVFDGKVSELLKALVLIAEKESIDMKARTWPKAPHVLTKRIKEVKSDLEETGIKITLGRDEYGSKVLIEKVQPESVSSVIAAQVANSAPEDQDLAAAARDIFDVEPKNVATDASDSLTPKPKTDQPSLDLPLPPCTE